MKLWDKGFNIDKKISPLTPEGGMDYNEIKKPKILKTSLWTLRNP